MAYSGKVTASSLNVRSGPGTNHPKVSSLSKGSDVNISETSQVGSSLWGNIGNGWICLTSGSKKYVNYSESGGTSTIDAAPEQQARESSTSYKAPNTVDTKDEVKTANAASMGTFQKLLNESANSGQLLKKSMRLFGLPYQFRPEVDVRISNVSSEIGRQFINNIVNDAQVITIVPGKPKYLPNSANKIGASHAFMSAASEKFEELQALLKNEKKPLRYYDFEAAYQEYMGYVNVMLHTAATFLELTQTIDGHDLQGYDWKNYRWNGKSYQSTTASALKAAYDVGKGIINGIASFGKSIINTLGSALGFGKGDNKFKYASDKAFKDAGEDLANMFNLSNYVEFMISPDFGADDSLSNNASDSKIKGMFDTGSDMLKELAFITNSGGVEAMTGLQDFASKSMQVFADAMSGGNSVTSFLKRFLDLSSNVMNGENVIMPKIYNSSDFEKSTQSITINLKCVYGDKFAYFMDVLVPLFHILALALPKQTSANTYGAPFLIKYICPGVATCNLGLVTSLTINKTSSGKNWTIDGFPSEIVVNMTITDLYSDLTMSPENAPLLFLSNTSLIDYIAATCGLNIIQPQLNKRAANTINTVKQAFGSIPRNVVGSIDEKIENVISGWTSIS